MMDAPNPATAGARALVDEFARLGVTHAVLAPGSRSAALAFALHDHPDVALHVHVDERSAGFVALGLARATGRPALVVTTSGSAVANLHPAVIEADADHVPLLLLTADRPAELRHTGANQTIDQVGLFGRATRWSVDVPATEDRADAVGLWRSTACRAFAHAIGSVGPPGPVQVNVAFREPTVPATDDGRSPAASFTHDVAGRPDGQPWTRVERSEVSPTDRELADLAEQVRECPRGVLVVGQTASGTDGIAALAEAAGWPILAEPTGTVRSSPRAIAHAHHLASHRGFLTTQRPGLVVRVGRSTLSPAIDAALDGVPQVLIDRDGSWLDSRRALHRVVVGDPDRTAARLAERLAEDGDATDPTWWNRWRAADIAVDDAIGTALAPRTAPSEPGIARDVAAIVPGGTVVVGASSMPLRDLDRYAAVGSAASFTSNRGTSGIDGFVSTTLGVALGAGGPVVGVVGDLAFLHDANGLLLDAAEPLGPVVFVVVDNDGGGIFSFLPQAGFDPPFERVFGTPHGRDLSHVGRLHGVAWHTAETADDVPRLVLDALGHTGVSVVHVRTDRRKNVDVHRELDAAAARALDALH
ncbi:MAG: 2-succinyl-5-enolpyruvyl-6-hydroxy-3-cyclohexene-1-carboxylic-acid synthase [Nitriliruptoraceae bacterium]